MIRCIRFAVNRRRARAADSFPAIGVEGDLFFASENQSLVHDVEHFEKRGRAGNIRRVIFDELAEGLSIFLPPDAEAEVHRRCGDWEDWGAGAPRPLILAPRRNPSLLEEAIGGGADRSGRVARAPQNFDLAILIFSSSASNETNG